MNREIKFRGKRIDNGEWVYGYYVKDPKGMHRIYFQPFLEATSNTYYFVQESTVGQYTGLKDNNGVEIYEGDVIRWVSSNPFSLGEIRKVKVVYVQAQFWCQGTIGVYLAELLANEKCEVIGNIYENPELIQ